MIIGLLASSEAEYSSSELINVLFFIILVDPGAVTWGVKKSKRARENSGEKKSRMQRTGSSLHCVLDSFSSKFFLARLDFFPPPLTAPGSPRMVFYFWRETLSYSLRSVVFTFTAFDVSPRGRYDFSEVFAEDVVGMQILREQDSI